MALKIPTGGRVIVAAKLTLILRLLHVWQPFDLPGTPTMPDGLCGASADGNGIQYLCSML
jgi:hypothetical protein